MYKIPLIKSYVAHSKGQLISKGNFSVFNSPKKNELENVNFCPSLLGQKFFVRFLGELNKPKSPFEINWPLHTCNKSHFKERVYTKSISKNLLHCSISHYSAASGLWFLFCLGHFYMNFFETFPFPQNPLEPGPSPVGPSSNPGADSEGTLMPN